MTANETDYELAYWNQPGAMHYEERKQYLYAQLMGIRREGWGFRVFGKSVVDIGGGPCSMLLRCIDVSHGFVVDPFLNDVPEHVDADRSDAYPKWVTSRYELNAISILRARGEDLPSNSPEPFDEAWIYNCLQHTDDPALILRNALAISRKLRIFEWINIPPHPGHPQELTKAKLDEWLSGTPGLWGGGEVHRLNHDGCFGDAYVAIVEGLAK